MLHERFLLVHPEIHLSFAAAEVHSILQIKNCVYTFKTVYGKDIAQKEERIPLVTVLTAEKKAVEYLLARAILISYAVSIPEADEPLEHFFRRHEETFLYSTYKINVTSYKRKLAPADKIDLMKNLADILDKKKACLKSPDITVEIIEGVSFCTIGILYRESNRKELIQKYCIKKRQFIGTTAMDNEISFILANLAQVTEKSIVLDCFAGTGSILLPCAVFGACVIGTDHNEKQYKGQNTFHTNKKIRTLQPGTDVYSNFYQFNLDEKAILFCVSDIFSRPILREKTIDAVICDPPYGRRESTKNSPTLLHRTLDIYINSSTSFIKRVFEQASYLLKPRGSLCFFVPHSTSYDLSGDTELFSLFSADFIEVCRCRQYLNSLYSRTAFLYRKKAI